MADLTALLLQVGRTVGDERNAKYSSVFVTELLNQGMRELAMITRNYNVATTLAVTAPGPTNLPADFIAMNQVKLGENPLWKLDYRQVRNYKNSTASLPSFFVIKNNQIQLYPLPSANVTLNIDYTATPPDLVAGADVPNKSLGSHRDAFLRMYAARELSVIGQDFEAAQHFAGQLGILEMKTRESVNTTDVYDELRVYPEMSMANDDRGVDGWLT